MPHAPMRAVTRVHVVPGRGIEGDRFYAARGTDVAYDEATCDVTLVEEEALEGWRGDEPHTEAKGSARRNIVVCGCRLEPLIGRTFRIGDVLLCGLAPHPSCSSALAQQSAACGILQHADLRAQILTEGMISIGDRLEAV